MRVLVDGATGAIGRPLVTALQAHGHTVSGLTRNPNGADLLSSLGAQPLLADVLDRDATAAALLDARPDVVVEQLTALPPRYTTEAMRAALAATGAVRTVGGDNVHAAAAAAGAHRYVAQSGCYYYRPGHGPANESEPWVDHGPPLVAGGVAALDIADHLDAMLNDIGARRATKTGESD